MKQQDKPLQLCIVGCGAISEQLYLPVLSKMPEFKLLTLIDVNLERARMLAERYNIPHYSAKLNDIPAIAEAALVALPNYLHCSVSCELMARGIHVFCEKPMATASSDAEAMVHCAKKHRVHLNIGNIRRFYWMSGRVKEIVDSKMLGDLLSFHIEEGYAHNWPTVSGFYFDKKKAGGGVLIDVGAHVIDLLLWWLQDYPTAIKYEDDDFGGVESECHIQLGFGDLTEGSIRLSRIRQLSNNYTLRFRNGTVTFQPYDNSGLCNALTINRNGKAKLLKAKKFRRVSYYFKAELAAFFYSIRTGLPSPIAADTIVPSIRLIGDCYRNARRLETRWLLHRPTCGAAQIAAGDQREFKNLKILVTGASGFIGGRVAERLYLEHASVPRCLVRGVHKLSRLARFPFDLMLGDVLNYDSLVKATAGCDAIVHCAYGNTRDDNLNVRINARGTENLIRAGLANDVKTFIYLSSVEVYGKNQPPVVDETTPITSFGNSYAISKFDGEKICLEYFSEKHLQVVILRLAVVYGPHAPTWTVDVINRLRNRGFCWSDQFNGTCNPIYIDDCVDAIFRAISRPNVAGETFIVSSGKTCTWNEYFAKYNEILEMPPLAGAGKTQLQLYRLLRKLFDLGFKHYGPTHGYDMAFTYSWLRERGRIPNLKAALQRGSLLDMTDILSRRTCYSIEKAKTILGFQPRYDLDSGIDLIKEWSNHA